MDLDLTGLGKIYAPVAAAAIAGGRILIKMIKKRETNHRKLISDVIERCEKERRDDRRECSRKHEELQSEIGRIRDVHAKEMSLAMIRLADSLDRAIRRTGNDPGTDSDLFAKKEH